MEDDALQIWENALANKEESTKHSYSWGFEGFLEWTGLSANQIRQMKLEEEEDPTKKPWQRTRVENMVRGYLAHLKKQGHPGGSRKVALTGINSFFDAQQLPLRLRREDWPSDCAYMHASGVPSEEDVKKMLDAARYIRERGLVLFLKDSGLRESDLPQILWKHRQKWYQHECSQCRRVWFNRDQESSCSICHNVTTGVFTGFWGFVLKTRKQQVKARPFVGPETVEVLKIYYRMRLEGTEKIPPETDIEEHPLFALFDDGSQPFQPKSMSHRLGKIIARAGLTGLSGHGLRKYWEKRVKADREAHIKQLNGRKLTDDERAYHWLSDEELFNLYRRNYHDLKLTKTVSDEVKQLRKEHQEEIEGLKGQIAILEQKLEKAKILATSPTMSRADIEELIRLNVAEELKKRGVREEHIKE